MKKCLVPIICMVILVIPDLLPNTTITAPPNAGPAMTATTSPTTPLALVIGTATAILTRLPTVTFSPGGVARANFFRTCCSWGFHGCCDIYWRGVEGGWW